MRAKTYKCDDCGADDAFTSYVKARSAGWAISKDYKHCYCPKCAPAHRFGAAAFANTGGLPAGWVQTSIDDLK